MKKEKLKSIIESVLFVGGDPMEISQISKITGADLSEVSGVVTEMSEEYKKHQRGLAIVSESNKVQLVTSPENSEYVESLIKGETQNSLSKTALETLSIISYRGPISRSDIDAIRGVNSSFILRNLLIRGLIEKSGNPKNSRGYVYKLTIDFMKKIGISKMEQLPDYEKLSKDEKIESIVKNNKEEK
ncbi:SMC-Scp complex subunit ScpB [Patescibacteria group bacterium]